MDVGRGSKYRYYLRLVSDFSYFVSTVVLLKWKDWLNSVVASGMTLIRMITVRAALTARQV